MNDACKVIAEKTALLLKIVYGAEIQRLFEQSERALESLGTAISNSVIVQKNPQQFADYASVAASQAAQVAAYGKQFAADEESPVRKKQLMDFGDELIVASDDIITTANRVIANPSDAQLLSLYETKLEGAQRGVRSILVPVKDEVSSDDMLISAVIDDDEILHTADELITTLPKLVDASQRLQINPNDKKAQENLQALLNNIKEESHAIVASTIAVGDLSAYKASLDNILAKMNPMDAEHFDPKNLLNSAQDLAGAIAQLAANAKSAVCKRHGDEASAAKELDDILNNLDKYVGGHKDKPISKSDLDELLSDLDKVSIQTSKKSDVQVSVEAAPKELESVGNSLANVAKSKPAKESSKKILATCESVGTDLTKLAAASQKCSGSEMLVHSNQIAKSLNSLIGDVKAIAVLCRDVIEQDKLIRYTQALKNYQIQLRILASVSAASAAERKPGGEGQLVALAKSLGKIVTETMNAVHAAEVINK